MSEKEELTAIPEAIISEESTDFSLIWLLPVTAVIIGLWLLFRTFASVGAEITIKFQDAEGLKINKTAVKYKEVTIGIVKDIRIAKNQSEVEVVAQLNSKSNDLLNNESRFWVVRPRIQGLSVSGINTLLSGAYIAMDPGKGEDDGDEFIGLGEPPSLLSHAQGNTYRLRADKLGSITKGAPVYYRDIVVGEVINYLLVPDHSHVAIDIFINMPHNLYVNTQSHFWNVSGIDLKMDAEGVAVNVQSVTSLLSGGIAFSTPANASPVDMAPEDHPFILYDSEDHSQQQVINLTLAYDLYFDDSVRGLSIGAPVEFRGIHVGEVQTIHLDRDSEDFRIVVTIGISPEHLVKPDEINGSLKDKTIKGLERLVSKGMRAQLKSGSLLTGQMFIEMDIHKDAPQLSIVEKKGKKIIPTIPNTISGITRSLTTLLSNLSSFPIKEIGENALAITKGANKMVNEEGFLTTVQEFNKALKSANELFGKLDPLIENANTTAADAKTLMKTLNDVSKAANNVFNNLDALTAEDGAFVDNISETIEEFSATAKSIRAMADYLERHPEALIQGKKP